MDIELLSFRNDAKTVNVIAEACFSPITKIAVTAIQFFLGSNDDKDDDSDDEDDVGDLLMHVVQVVVCG
jgi:protein SDA1